MTEPQAPSSSAARVAAAYAAPVAASSSPEPVTNGAADSSSQRAVWTVPRGAGIAFVLLAVAAFVLSALLWQKLSSIQEQLARQSADSGTAAVEARALARQAQELARDVGARQAVAETKLGEAALQRTQLEELMKSLSRSRDENLVVDIESALQLAQQQSQLTGSLEPLMAALKSADLRLSRAAQPRLAPLQRAIAKDIDRIKATTVADTPNLLVKMDELVRLVDDLPLANSVGLARLNTPPKPAAKASAPADWWDNSVAVVLDELRRLVRVSRIEQPEAALLTPEQSYFVRENLKLKLLNARLGLLARLTDSARADLQASEQLLNKYFDTASRKTQTALQLLQQVQGQARNLELPRLDGSMAALTTAVAGR